LAEPPTLLRRCAAFLVRHAAGGRASDRPRWAALLQAELERIQRDREALIWAIGCAWSTNVERYFSKGRPFLTSALLVLGLYVTTHYLLAHLSWYGFTPRPPVDAEAPSRMFIKLALFLTLTILVRLVTPGEPRRKLIAAVAFPLLAMMILEVSRAASEVTEAVTPIVGSSDIGSMVRVALFGVVVSALVSLPFVLVYRRYASALACLAMVPTFARFLGELRPTVHTMRDVLGEMAPFACSFLLITLFSSTILQWLLRPTLHPASND
jgi:hypothetical protein